MKTNKSFTKRLKVTRTGKVLSRKSGQNHFNAKEGRRSQLKKRSSNLQENVIPMSNKDKARFLPRA